MVLDLKINNNKEKISKSSISQQMLVNALLAEQQPTRNAAAANAMNVEPVKQWRN